ncbi:MAG: hypothetical protein M0Z47_00160 [Actinomycetota bacterium]|nr:hypothetical protein [Actinomycetota bacterium]
MVAGSPTPSEEASPLNKRTLPTIDPHLYEPDPDNPPYLRYVGSMLVRDVAEVLAEALGKDEDGFVPGFDYFAESAYDDMRPWPGAPGDGLWRVVCFAATGANEGWYVHVGAIYGNAVRGRYEDLLCGKVDEGEWFAHEAVARIARILQL